MGTFSLEDQLAFYGAFHNNRLNQIIHIIFVPLILWSAMVFFIFLTPGEHHSLVEMDPKSVLAHILPEHGINLSLPIFLLYAVYYLTLDVSAALVYNVFLFFLYHGANSFAHSTPNALWIAAGLHVLAWYAQIHPGHLVCEGRRPALLQSFFQSLVLAPLFTFFEILFMLGFKKKLAERIARRVNANIKQFKSGVPPEKQTF